MAEPFLSEIRLMSFNFPPKGWALCNGQLLPINQNQPLFSLLGTTYGGNGQTTFALPDLRGRLAMHAGNGHTLGEAGGAASVTITQSTMPQHLHFLQGANKNGDQVVPTGNLLANANNLYRAPTNLVGLPSGTVANVGGSQPHTNMSPFLALNYCIALVGIFPSPN